jgi:hypothetical protein
MFRSFNTVLLLLLILSVPDARVKDKHSARFDGLVFTATAMESDESTPHRGDRHFVAVYVTIKNPGKLPACASFLTASLKTTDGLKYYQIKLLFGAPPRPFPREPRVWEMLPGEETSGGYVFNLKDGVEPLELSLGLLRRSMRCGSGRENWSEALLPEEVRLDVRDLPLPSSSQNESKVATD